MRIRIKNKKRFGIVLSIVLVLTAMISGTYSLFYHENTAQSKEDYSTGILNIVANSKSDNINLTNALPMTDEEGVRTEPYVFTIENRGNLDYNFNIRLLSTSDNPINPDYIKLKIDDGEVTTLSALSDSIIKGDITLKAKENMDVSIRIWLASNTPNSQIGKVFNSKIITEGKAVYTENNDIDVNPYIKVDLPDGMIPIKYDNENDIWLKADVNNSYYEWYDYNAGKNQWANAVMVSSSTRDNYMNASVDTPILENDILAYYVYVPRYRYKLFNVNSDKIDPISIEIEFQTKEDIIDNGTQNGEWLTHPAFWWDNNSNGIREEGEELSGIWVGKFETGGTETKPLIKPNIVSTKGLTLYKMFNMLKKFQSSVYLTNNGVSEVDVHIAKNIDWGVIAYLSHSKYGINKEICTNNSSSYYTGRSGGNVGGSVNTIKNQYSGSSSSSNQYIENGYYTYNNYVINYSGTITSDKEMDKGTCASTTGNVFGIYDMVGGSKDYIMGVIATSSGGIFYHNSKFTNSNMPKSKYYDLYDYDTLTTSRSRRKLGDATGETYYWYRDGAYFINNEYGWFVRGAKSKDVNYVGIFYYSCDTGSDGTKNSASRSVLVLP